MLVLFYVIPNPIRDFLYDLVAKSRYSVFGKTDKCLIYENKDWQDRILDGTS